MVKDGTMNLLIGIWVNIKGENNMPMVNGKKYPYTKKGKAAAKKAKMKKYKKKK
jgi:hypothetical protein